MGGYFNRVILGIVGGLIAGFLLGHAFPQKPEHCKARVSSAHMEFCLDSKFDKAKELFR